MPSIHEGKFCPAFWSWQGKVRAVCTNTKTEVFVALLIFGNFLMNLIEATIDPLKNKYTDAFATLELFFNGAFTVELSMNMYAFWFKPFWSSGWNVFDFIVVSIGLLTTFKVPLPGPFTMLRMMRAFRVFRLFKRIKALKKILDSLTKAIPGVVNAFVILVLVMCIYAILAVEFWANYGAGGQIINELNMTVPLTTARGQDYGFEYFGNFPKAMYTMFQCLTGESWSEAIARPLLHTPDTIMSIGTAFYFVSFVVLCAVILINVVVAVLLEKMVDDSPMPEDDNQDDMDFKLSSTSWDGDADAAAAADEGKADGGADEVDDSCGVQGEIVAIKRDLEEIRQQVRQILQVAQLTGDAHQQPIKPPPAPCHPAADPDGAKLRSCAGAPNDCNGIAPPAVVAPAPPAAELPSLPVAALDGARKRSQNSASEEVDVLSRQVVKTVPPDSGEEFGVQAAVLSVQSPELPGSVHPGG